MKKLILTLFTAVCISNSCYSKNVQVVVIPNEATIKVNGAYYGEGSVIIPIKKNDFVSLEFNCPGYETLHTRIHGSDPRKTIEVKLKENLLPKLTIQSGISNRYFSVTVSKNLYSENPTTGERNSGNAWKMAHSVLLNYFDELQSSDMASGFIQTPWYYKSYPEINKTIRVRVTIKESNIGGDLSFQIKVSSEIAPIQGRYREEFYQEIDRIPKEFENIISEFQTRLGIK